MQDQNMSLSKSHVLSGIWNKNSEIKNNWDKVKRLLSKPEFFELLPIPPAQNGEFNLISAQMLRRILKTTKSRLKQDCEDLLDKVNMLNDWYGMEVQVKKSSSGKIEVERRPTGSTWEAFQINGSILKKLKSNRGRTSPIYSPVNQIEVRDITPCPSKVKQLNPLSTLLLEINNEVTPTVIKVVISDRVKRFLIYVPHLVNTSMLNKVYRPALAKIQPDFYMKKYRGRPKSKRDQEQKIFNALKKYRGRKISTDDLCRKAAKRVELSPSTIKRHYLLVIQRIKQARIHK